MTRQKEHQVFWRNVRFTDACWEWTLTLDRDGYGHSNLFKRRMVASRVSWIIANGEIPGGMLVCHKCDNRKCVRPDHLFLGTQADNIADMLSKGRRPTWLKPEPRHLDDNNAAKVTAQDAHEIRTAYRMGVQTRELARLYGISQGAVSHMLVGRQWVSRA